MPKLPVVFLAVVLNGVLTGARIICNGYCDDAHIGASYCTGSRTCVERVRRDQIIEVFADDETNCYSERELVFMVYIKSISAQVHNETLSIDITWEWPPVVVTQNRRNYEVQWGLQYIVTIPGESRANCYTVYLSEAHVSQGRLNVPCVKFNNNGFPHLEFNVTALAFVAEKFKTGLSFTPSRLQEITIKTGELDSVSVPVWNPETRYKLTDHVLTVSFNPAPVSLGYTSYEVHIFKAQESKCIPGASYVNKTVTVPYWPTASVTFNTENYEECAKYCIGLHPIRSSGNWCSEGCVSEMHDMVLFQVPAQILKCEEWNAKFIVYTDPYKGTISVSFNVWPEYEFCFNKFRMVLFSPLRMVCKPRGTVISTKTFSWNSSSSSVIFEGLAPGNYCVRVTPDHEVCRTKNKDICSLLYSDIHNLGESMAEASNMPIPETPVFNQELVVSVISVAGIIVLVTMGGILWRKSRNPQTVDINISEASSSEDLELLEDSHLNNPRRVFVFYTHDQQTKTETRALANFLRYCRHYEVFLDEDHKEKIFAVNSRIIPKILEFSCTYRGNASRSDDKRFIFVKSRRAARLFKKEEIITNRIIESGPVNFKNWDGNQLDNRNIVINCNGVLPPNEEEPSGIDKRLDESFFRPAVDSMASLSSSLMDNCHIFVVQFGDSDVPESEMFSLLTPGQRYVLPDELGDLCLNLNRIDDPKSATKRAAQINKMHREWKESRWYKELKAVCQ